MSDESIDYQAAEAVLRATRTPVIKPGAKLDRAFSDWCRTVEFGATQIMSLFPKAAETAAAKIRYQCELQCPTCEVWRIQDYGKGSVRDLVSVSKRGHSYRDATDFDCEGCQKAKVEECKRSYDPDATKKWMQKHAEEQQEAARQRTPTFIESYLDPSRKWNPEMTQDLRFQLLTLERLDGDLLTAAINNMTEEDFLRTPYWIAVHGEAIRRAGNKCSLCALPGQLTVQYRSSPRFGYQHTEEGLREILCLCQRCKSTHLLVKGSQSN